MSSIRRPRRRGFFARPLGAALASVALVAATVPAVAHASQRPGVSREGDSITMCGREYCAELQTGDGVYLSSLRVGDHEMLETSSGLRTSITTPDGEVTSRDVTGDPRVQVTRDSVTVTLDTALVEETWSFEVSRTRLDLAIERNFTADTTLVQQGFPLVSYEKNAIENIRWPEDGGNFPVGGELVDTYQESWLSGGDRISPGIRTAKRQASYVALDETSQTALSVAGETSYDDVHYGRATELWRSGDSGARALNVALLTAADGVAYAGGNPLGYSVQSTKDGSPVFTPVGAVVGQIDRVDLSFTPADYDDYYDLGTLNGVDEKQLSKVINDYARWMMQDTDMAGSTESPQLQSEVPPLEMHWIGQMVELFPTRAAVGSYLAGVQDIREHLTEASGRIICCQPGWGATWGFDYGDHISGYVLAVVQGYRLSGDDDWLAGMRESTNRSLDYLVSEWTDPATHFVRNVDPEVGPPDYNNDYWESSTGTFNGYTTAMLYDALTSWAAIEQDAFGDAGRTAELTEVATTIKENFNKDVADGGFWSSATHTFLYGSGNQDALYLPVNAAVVRSDLADRDREEQIVSAILAQKDAGNYDLTPMNVRDLYQPGTLAPTAGKGGENGGWYGIPEGEFYAGLALLDDPIRLQMAITSFLSRYRVDGFYGASAYDRDDPTVPTASAAFFPLTALPAWGLYHYGYGFQPQTDRLVLAPHITSGMTGSSVDYLWRNVPMTVTYRDVDSYRIDLDEPLTTPLTIRWTNQEPGTDVRVRVNGFGARQVTVDGDGNADVNLPAGTNRHVNAACLTCTHAGTAPRPDEHALGKVQGDTTRNDIYGQVGTRFAVGPHAIEVTSLGRFKSSGNDEMHRVKILDVDGRIVASSVVDMSDRPGRGGFVTARLSRPVRLEPGIYYAMSMEAPRGDTWLEAASVASGPNVTVLGAARGRSLTIDASGAAHGPVTFGYRALDDSSPWIQELVTPPSAQASSGDHVRFVASVSGQAASTLDGSVTVEAPEGWRAEPQPFTLETNRQVASVDVPLTVSVPADAETGTYSLTVTASTADGLTSSRTVTVSVANTLFDFDDGIDQGWQPGPGVTDLKAVTSIANGPGSPYEGSHLLEFLGPAAPGTSQSIFVEPETPLDLSHASELYAHINSWGAWPLNPDSYEATITLYSGDDSISATTTYNANVWNRASIDLSGWAGRSAITRIEVAYVVNVDTDSLQLRFDLDSMGFDV